MRVCDHSTDIACLYRIQGRRAIDSSDRKSDWVVCRGFYGVDELEVEEEGGVLGVVETGKEKKSGAVPLNGFMNGRAGVYFCLATAGR